MMAPSANLMAVVGHELRVHGLAGLRVADASIMPTVATPTPPASDRREMRGDDAGAVS
jgi:choline dehydrogenase